MKIKVNTFIISKLYPCKDRLANWLNYYIHFDDDICKFLDLKNITHSDKLWVTLRLIPAEMRVVFALDMAFSAAAYDAGYAAVAVAADAAAAAAAAADVAYDTAVAAAAYAAYAADADYVAVAAIAATAAADYAVYAADYDDVAALREQESQIKVLKYLIRGEK